jgi:hypothetical protein
VCRESDVTSANLVVFQGTPIVTLMSEVDVPEGFDPKKEPTEDDLEPISDPLTAVACRIMLTEIPTKATAAQACAKTEDIINQVIARGNGSVSDIHYSQCPDTKEIFALVTFTREEEVLEGEVMPPDEVVKPKRKGDK